MVGKMESAGSSLKGARELRKLSLEEAAKFTKIRKHLLRAIEEERYDLLPPSFYVRGFLAAYAKYLGLDPDDVVHAYQSHWKNHTTPQRLEPHRKAPPLKSRIRRSPSLFPILAITIFVTVFIFLGSNQLSEWTFPSSLSTRTPLPVHEKEEAQTIYQVAEKEISTFPPLEILEASTGTGIENRGGFLIMTGKSSEFICNNQRAYFFTRIKTQREGKIAHVWLWEGKEFHRTEIEVKPPACSVYSYLTLRPQHVGSWKAEVRDGDNIIESFPFKTASVGSYSIKEKEKY